jgi:hypothetical protein
VTLIVAVRGEAERRVEVLGLEAGDGDRERALRAGGAARQRHGEQDDGCERSDECDGEPES